MKMKLLMISKFFFLTDGGKFRKSYFFQIISLYLGALIISLTYSIMNGMEKEVFDKFKSFNYKYAIKENISVPADNIGKKSLVRFDFKNYDLLVNVISYDKYNEFMNEKIKTSLLYDHDIYNKNSIVIGESLSELYNINIGDTINLSDISNINIVTGAYKIESFIVANIFNFAFLNFDYDNVFIKENHSDFLMLEDYISYYSNNLSFNNISFENDFIFSESKYSSLLSSIKFEKNIYVLLGFLTIVISSIMMFNNTLLVLFEKKKQIKALISIGMSVRIILYIIIFCNLILSGLLGLAGLSTALFIEKLNIWFNIIDYLFIYSPFNKIPMNLSLNQFIVTLLLIIILTFISTILSINKMKYKLDRK
tara:strand:+ start:863 stop:1960 length:1098 start_codon:yes stop_codon:yes gene_type:complete